MKYWEIIGDKLHRAGFSVGCVSALDKCGRTVWIVDAHGDGKRFVVRAGGPYRGLGWARCKRGAGRVFTDAHYVSVKLLRVEIEPHSIQAAKRILVQSPKSKESPRIHDRTTRLDQAQNASH
jgi:hypothetical protein